MWGDSQDLLVSAPSLLSPRLELQSALWCHQLAHFAFPIAAVATGKCAGVSVARVQLDPGELAKMKAISGGVSGGEAGVPRVSKRDADCLRQRLAEEYTPEFMACRLIHTTC